MISPKFYTSLLTFDVNVTRIFLDLFSGRRMYSLSSLVFEINVKIKFAQYFIKTSILTFYVNVINKTIVLNLVIFIHMLRIFERN